MPYSPLRLVATSVHEANGSVFHYTGSGSLLGMVQGRTLRASEASGMNDLAEVRQGWSTISRLLAAMPPNTIVELLASYAADPMQSQHEVFVLCAAHDGDDANQWRLYGDHAKGYAVELDATVPLGVVSAVDRTPRTSGHVGTVAADIAEVGPWLHVMYHDDEISTALHELVASVRSEEEVINTTAADEDEAIARWDELKTEAYAALATVAHLIKSPGFSGEREVRLVATFIWLGEHVHFRDGAYGIVGYVELATSPSGYATASVIPKPTPADPLDPLPIRSVRLGPLARVEQQNALEGLLRRSALGAVDVLTSEVPLR